MITQQNTGWDPAAYLRDAAEADARHLADTRALIGARDNATLAAVLERLTPLGGPVDPHSPTLMAGCFGALGYRTETIIARLERAEARVAELEAEHACQHGTTCIGPERDRA